MAKRDPLSNPEPLIRRVYAYVAYRIGPGADAEDVTSAVVERAVRYRASYDPAKGDAHSWLLGIARTCVNDHLAAGSPVPLADVSLEGTHSEESATIDRLNIASVVSRLDGRDRELIALRYGADLSSREIGDLLGMKPTAVDVALQRARERLRGELEQAGYGPAGKTRVLRTAAEPLS